MIRQRLRSLEKTLGPAAEGDVEALHQARVASRRIREALPLLKPAPRVRRLERQMRRITRTLGPVRELDVVLQLVDELDGAGEVSRPALARLREAVAHERTRLHAGMRRQIEEYDLRKLRKRALTAARHAPQPLRRGRKGDPRQIARAQLRASQRAERLRAAIESAAGLYLPDRLHDVRIAVKKLRYGLELVRELAASRATARIRALRRAQDLLGRMHDLEVLIARTRAVQGAPGAPDLKLSAELDRLVRRLETECRRLHGQYTASRHKLTALCDHVVAAAAKAAAPAA